MSAWTNEMSARERKGWSRGGHIRSIQYTDGTRNFKRGRKHPATDFPSERATMERLILKVTNETIRLEIENEC